MNMQYQVIQELMLYEFCCDLPIRPVEEQLKQRMIGKHYPIYPTPPLRQDMTQGQFLSRV